MQPPSFDQWINAEYPQLRDAYISTHGGNIPTDEWASFQTMRRLSAFIPALHGGDIWTFERMVAWERSQGAGTPAPTPEPP